MKFICRETCIDSAKCYSYRTGLVYDFAKSDIEHLKMIDQFKRFEPVDMDAKIYTGVIKEPEEVLKEAVSATFEEMTKEQLVTYAEDNGINVNPRAKKDEIIKAITG